MKSALIYYSNTGKTKEIAEEVKEIFNPDEFEIEIDKPYGGFISSVGRYIGEHISKKNPKVTLEPKDFSEYDIVFLGSPVWAGTLPNFLQDYLKECNFKDTTVIPFITAAGTGKESTFETIKEIFPESNISNYFFKSKRENNDVGKWLEEVRESYS